MTTSMAVDIATGVRPVPWWKEPTREQWFAWTAASLGWVLDAFDFTLFLLIMASVAQAFSVSLTAVASVVSVTLALRFVGAVGNGWLADRIGRKTPLMLSIGWFSLCNFIAGFSPSFWFLFLFRALLGIGMGAEWGVGASLAMESWPARSRGFMAGVMQGGWGLGFLLASGAYGLLFNLIGWRGMLWIGILPALLILFIRVSVTESQVWLEHRSQRRRQSHPMAGPFLSIFKRKNLGNTLNALWWQVSGMVVYYSIWSLFATHLQVDLHLSPALVATPLMLGNVAFFLGATGWGWVADRLGRRWTLILIAAIGIPITPIYLFSHNISVISLGLLLQGLFAGGGINTQNASYMTERFPTESRATAAGFCYQLGAVAGGFTAPAIAYSATAFHLGFAVPMLVGTVAGLVSYIITVYFGPETKGKILGSEPAAV